jgi:hypothetical protein
MMLPEFIQIYVVLPLLMFAGVLLFRAWRRDRKAAAEVAEAMRAYYEGSPDVFEMTRSEMDAILGIDPDPSRNTGDGPRPRIR